eukprot:gene1135-1110_t
MTNLDPRSMIALAGFMSAVMAMVLLFMRRHYPPSIRGVGGWAAAPLLWLLSTVLFGARGAIPDWLGLVLANQLLVLGSVTYYMGTRQFMGQPATWRTWNWVMAGTTVVFAWLTYGWPNYAVRVGFFTMVMGVLYAAQLRFMLRHGGRNFPVRLVEVMLGLHMLVLGMRLGSILAGHAGNDLMEPSLFQTLYIGAYALTVLMLSIGAVLMATDRLRTELEHLATYDSLTQTLNRRALLQRCEDELERAQRYADTQAALGVARRIHATLASGHPLDCKVSIGLTSWTGSHETLDAMLSRADAALYRAKEEGRNRTVVG